MYGFLEYSMREIKEQDLRLIYDWRNSEKIHSKMLTNHKIKWDEHIKWFEKSKKTKVKLSFIFEYNKIPIGYIGYQDLDFENQRVSIGLYLAESSNNILDAGIMISYFSLEYAFKELKINKIWTYVLKKNKKALKLNKYMGYLEEGMLRKHFLKSGILEDACLLGILKEEWNEKKIIIEKTLKNI